MTIYLDDIFYRDGVFYGPSSISIPQDLQFYRSALDGIYVFHWGFSSAFISPSLATFDYELQLDTVSTFDSPNLVDFLSADVISFQNGNIRKGYTVSVNARIDKIEQIWYARVRIVEGLTYSLWSSTLTWSIPQKYIVQEAENLMNALPDSYVYGKEDLKLPISQRKSLIYTIDTMYGQQYDAVLYENFLTANDNYIDLCRDEFLQQNFGIQFNFTKPTNMQYADYRWILKQLIIASLDGGTNEAISLVVAAFTGVPPNLSNIRSDNDFFLNTIQDSPIVPSGSTTVFHTSYPFIGGTLTVEDLTTGLLVSSGNYTENPVKGIWTMTVATTDTLQAIFDVGGINDPVPLVFDSTDYTALSGTVTFTHGSDSVTGASTLFTSELSVGNEITDAQGIYLGIVSVISDDTHLSFINPWFGPIETVSAFKLHYTDVQLPPPIDWAKKTLANGLVISVLNPGLFLLDQNLIETLGGLVFPATLKVYWMFPS